MMDWLIPATGSALECAGLVLIRGPHGVVRPHPWPLAGWGAILAGAVLWQIHSPYGAGVSWALLILCCGGLALAAIGGLAKHAAQPLRSAAVQHRQASRWWRLSLPRLLGTLLAAPLCGLEAGLVLHGLVPGDGASKLAACGLGFLFFFAFAMIWSISVAQAWRGLGWLAALDAAAAAGLAFYLPVR